MGKLNNKDWWLGKTNEQQEKNQARREKNAELMANFRADVTGKPRLDLPSEDQVLAQGAVDSTVSLVIYADGTFVTKGLGGLGKASERDRLLGFEHEADSMRRKSVVGRGAAAIATSGLSLAAANNRGVLYVTLTGERTGVRTFTTRNPSGTILTDIRTLKASADAVILEAAPTTATQPAQADVPEQIQKLADLHAAGVLTDEEFAAKKDELLRRM